MMITTILSLLSSAKTVLTKTVSFKAICGLAVALSIVFNIFLWKRNNKLSESLEMAQNNIESYEGALFDRAERNRVLMFDVQQLQNSNDKLIQELDSVMKSNKVKLSKVQTAATQTQEIYVTASREVQEQSIQINNPTKHYKDSIQFNEQTIVSYDISEDSIDIQLDVKNTQYLYTYSKKEWKNKKSFLKRLFTLDFKKVKKYNYEIVNTNDIIQTSNVRVIEINK